MLFRIHQSRKEQLFLNSLNQTSLELFRALGFEGISVEVFLSFVGKNREIFQESRHPMILMVTASIFQAYAKNDLNQLNLIYKYIAPLVDSSDIIKNMNPDTVERFLIENYSDIELHMQTQELQNIEGTPIESLKGSGLSNQVIISLKAHGFNTFEDLNESLKKSGVNEAFQEVNYLQKNALNKIVAALKEWEVTGNVETTLES